METLEVEYRLSLYECLSQLNSSPKSEVSLVKSSLNDKIYIKKVLKTFNREVFERLKDIQTIHIPRIYEILEWKENLIIIEEFVNGQTLQEIIDEQGTLPESVAIRYMLTLCEVLTQLHQQDPPIIHRDLKPSNVMITNEGILKLIDFDVSRIYNHECGADTHILGTKGYASPEQFGFEQTDVRSDIYSIGVMINVLITQKTPKECPLDSSLRLIVEKCTSFSPEKRYQQIRDLQIALTRLIDESHTTVGNDKIYSQHMGDGNIYKSVIQELGQLPGYRGRFFPFKLLATFWYLFLLFGAFHQITRSNLAMASMLLLFTLLNGNYKGIWYKNLFLRKSLTLGLIVYNCLIFMFFGYFV